MTCFLAFMACFLFVLAALGAIADAWDPFDEKADARRRNRDQAHRL